MPLCSCPYGPRMVWPLFFIWAATTCTYYAAFECTFFKVRGLFKHGLSVTYGLWTTEEYENNQVVRQEVKLLFGVWDVGEANSCTLWSSHPELEVSDLDSPLVFARTVSLIACTLGGLLWFWINFATCRIYSDRTIRIACCTMLATAIFVAFSFWALRSAYCADKDCSVDFAGWIGVAAVLLWLISICMVLKFLRDPNSEPKKRKPLFRRRPRRPRRRQNRRTPDTTDDEEEQVPLEDPPEYRDDAVDDHEAEDEPDMEGAMVPYSGPHGSDSPYGLNRNFSIDDDEDEPVIDPYDQDPFVNASDYQDDREPQPYSSAISPPPEALADPRVFGSQDPNFEPADKVYGGDDLNAVPADRVYAGDDPFAVPSEKVYGNDDPNAFPPDRVFAGDDPFAVPNDKVYEDGEPDEVRPEKVFGGDTDPFAVENPFASPDSENQGSMVPFGIKEPSTVASELPASATASNPFDAPEVVVAAAAPSVAPKPPTVESSLQPPAPSTTPMLVAAPPPSDAPTPASKEPTSSSSRTTAEEATKPTAAARSRNSNKKERVAAMEAALVVPAPHANQVGEDLSDISDNDEEEDEEILQSTVLFGEGAHRHTNNAPSGSALPPTPGAAAAEPLGGSRPSSRASFISVGRPSSRASQRSRQSETKSIGKWELQF